MNKYKGCGKKINDLNSVICGEYCDVCDDIHYCCECRDKQKAREE